MDADYLYYETDFNSILDGIHRYKDTVYVLDSENKPKEIKLYYYRNIEIDSSNQIKVSIKKSIKPFANFSDYYCRLLSDMSKMYENARDSKRCHKYGIVTMISKGYDAPCCAAIVKELGGNTALTFKAEGKYAEDSGVEIAKKLGYGNIIERDALEYLNRTDMPEIEYISSGELGSDISFCAFEKDFKGNMVFSGDRGDSIWGKSRQNRNDEFKFIDMLSHLGMSEKRLWNSFIQVPMPLYGAGAWSSIYEISNSEEMLPWRVGTDYDRPIPRRIIETAGVDRHLFGISKHGAGFTYRYDWLGRILRRMSKTTGESFKNYVKENRRFHPIQFATFFAKAMPVYMRRLGIKAGNIDEGKMGRISNPMAARYLIPWAGNYMIRKYRDAMEGQIS